MIKKIDSELFAELQALPHLPFHRAIKQDKKTLQKKRDDFFKYNKIPKFIYPKAHDVDTDGYLKAIQIFENNIEKSGANPIIKKLYKKKVQELRTRCWLVKAICKQDDKLVTRLSRNLFGTVRQTAEELETEFNEMLDHANKFKPQKKPITAAHFVILVQRTLDHYGMDNWKIRLVDSPSISIGHGLRSQDPIIRIPKDLRASKKRAAKLLTHEIEVHALRTHNGAQSPIALFERGLDRYSQTEEGLATYFQGLLNETPSNHAPGFWDAWTIALTETLAFEDVFEKIAVAKTKLNQAIGYSRPRERAEDSAWRLCVRAYRAIADPSKPGVGFWRDHIYRSGNTLIHDLVEKYPDMINVLFSGNIGVQHLPEITQLDLPKARTPELISKRLVDEL